LQVAPHFLKQGLQGGNMHISKTLAGILVKAALSAKTKSERKEHLMHLYHKDMIDGFFLSYLIKSGGLKHE